MIVRDLNAFRRDLLATAALYDPATPEHDRPYGAGLKRALEGIYGRRVNNGQLYPALSELVDRGLLRVRADNQRTNYYKFTDRGRAALMGYARFLASASTIAHAGSAAAPAPSVLSDGLRTAESVVPRALTDASEREDDEANE